MVSVIGVEIFAHPVLWLNVGSMPLIYLLILLTKQGYKSVVMLSSFWGGWNTCLLTPRVNASWLYLITPMLQCLMFYCFYSCMNCPC